MNHVSEEPRLFAASFIFHPQEVEKWNTRASGAILLRTLLTKFFVWSSEGFDFTG